jgi:secondary thiamine-phosphate synthase enzyme
MVWIQHVLRLPAQRRGLHLISRHIVDAVPELASIRVGLLHVFLQHTSAALTVNENADPDVRLDLERWLSEVVAQSREYRHRLEGPDDMPAHIKSSLLGHSLTIPVRDGRLALGTWQGIYLCEHRDQAEPRHVVLTLHGEQASA